MALTPAGRLGSQFLCLWGKLTRPAPPRALRGAGGAGGASTGGRGRASTGPAGRGLEMPAGPQRLRPQAPMLLEPQGYTPQGRPSAGPHPPKPRASRATRTPTAPASTSRESQPAWADPLPCPGPADVHGQPRGSSLQAEPPPPTPHPDSRAGEGNRSSPPAPPGPEATRGTCLAPTRAPIPCGESASPSWSRPLSRRPHGVSPLPPAPQLWPRQYLCGWHGVSLPKPPGRSQHSPGKPHYPPPFQCPHQPSSKLSNQDPTLGQSLPGTWSIRAAPPSPGSGISDNHARGGAEGGTQRQWALRGLWCPPRPEGLARQGGR